MNFKNLKFDIERIVREDKLVIDVYPQFRDHIEFADPEKNELFIIMILATDENSPFVNLYRDSFEMRMQKVYEWLERNLDGLYAEILSGQNAAFNEMTFKWFALSDNLAYESWFSKSMNFHYMTSFLRQKPDFNNIEKNMATRAQIEKAIDGIHKNLIEFEKQVFPDERVRKVVKEQVAKSLHFPEEFAEDKEDGFGNVRVI